MSGNSHIEMTDDAIITVLCIDHIRALEISSWATHIIIRCNSVQIDQDHYEVMILKPAYTRRPAKLLVVYYSSGEYI
jgi:hypothetical protein